MDMKAYSTSTNQISNKHSHELELAILSFLVTFLFVKFFYSGFRSVTILLSINRHVVMTLCTKVENYLTQSHLETHYTRKMYMAMWWNIFSFDLPFLHKGLMSNAYSLWSSTANPHIAIHTALFFLVSPAMWSILREWRLFYDSLSK